jgi:O-antigen/teichoic acid export membrane protein
MSSNVKGLLQRWDKLSKFSSSLAIKSLNTNLFRATVASLALKVCSALLGLLVSILLARKLSPEGFGIYSYALAIVSLLAIPVHFGMPTLIVRQVARYHRMAQWSLLRGILVRANQMVLAVSITVLIGVSAFAWLTVQSENGSVQTAALYWALLLLPLSGFNSLRESALQGLRRVVAGQLPEAIVLPISFVSLLLVASNIGTLTPQGAIALYCFATLIALIVGSVFLIKALPKEVKAAEPKYESRNWLHSLMPLSLLGGLHIVNSQVDVFMLGLFSSKESVGLFRVAYSGAALVLFFMSAMSAVVAPNIARLHNAGKMRELQRVATLGARVCLIAGIPIAGCLSIFGAELIQLIYGNLYLAAYTPLVILCVAQMINVLTGFVHVALNMMGHERATLTGMCFSVLLNVVLNITLIPAYQEVGAAISAAVAIVAVNIYLCCVLYFKTGISTLPITPKAYR